MYYLHIPQMWTVNIHAVVAAAPSCFCVKRTVNLDTCSATKHHKEKKHTWQDGNTHLECNIIILVNRSASLQHIFWRAVFSLLVRQRCLPCGHRNAKKRVQRSQTTVLSPRRVQEGKTRAVSVRSQSESPPASSPSARILRVATKWSPGASQDRKKITP